MYKTLLSLMISGVAVAFSNSCDARSQQSVSSPFAERVDNQLRIVSGIDQELYLYLFKNLAPRDHLIIKSLGGERSIAQSIAQMLSEREITLTINSDCFSACALYIALTNSKTVVPYGATILYHNDTAMWIEALSKRPELFSEEEAQKVRIAHDELTHLLASRNIDPQILQCLARAVGPNFSEARRAGPFDRDRTADVGVIIPTERDWVWLSAEVLQHFGASNVQVQWELTLDARPSYQAIRGYSIAWVDRPEQC